MPKKMIFDNAELYEYYVIGGHTYEECAQYFHTSRGTITKYIKECGYQQSDDVLTLHRARPSKYKVDIDRDILYDLYIKQNLTKKEIADKLQLSTSVVTHRLSEFGIIKSEDQRVENAKVALLQKFADDTEAQSIKEKRAATNLKRYGCLTPSQNDVVKNKIKQTNLARYGVECALLSDEAKSKSIDTIRTKYGCDHPMQNNDVKLKVANTTSERYGVSNISKLQSVRNKKRIASLTSLSNSDTGRIAEVTSDRNTFREYIISNNFTTTKQISDDLNYGVCSVERLLALYDCWDLIKNYKSGMELEVKAFLESIGIHTESRRDIIPPYEIDMYNDTYKIGVEFNGNYWHSSLEKPKTYHEHKSKLCEEVGVRLIHIYEYEWSDPKKRCLIESLLRIAFGKTQQRIYARKCEIREITNSEARAFNERNHLQGHKNAQVTYGLFYQNNLVQLMSFSYKANKGWWEIERGCPGSNNIVVGGVSKLFQHFLKQKRPQKVFSYCDFNKFDGRGYEAIGMKCIGYTGPDMKWLINNTVINRSPKNHKMLQTSSDAKIWGSGSKKYLWTAE